jgi:hypothetical protein
MIPLQDPEGHRWVSPGEFDCPNCRCCTIRLCERAAEQRLSCSWLCPPQEGQHDTSNCPCTAGHP